MGTARLGTANRMGTSRLGTAARGGEDQARPMTSIRAAGYTSSGRVGTSAGLNAAGYSTAGQGPAPPLETKTSNTPEDVAREMEKEVNELLEESATANVDKKPPLALDRAKKAAQKERKLGKHREQHQLMDQMNIDLTYAVCFNLAAQYEANEMYPEALNTYSLIVKNKQYAQSGRLRVNMGNIYFKQKPPRYPTAIKMYRMALDQIPASGKEMRFKIMRNIAHAFVRMGNYKDAQMSYEAIMEAKPDLQAGFNLLVCYFALGDKEKMKQCLSKLLAIRETDTGVPLSEEDEKDDKDEDGEEEEEDELRKSEKEARRNAKQLILLAAKLIAPKLADSKDGGVVAGFDYVIEALKSSQDYVDVASDMIISKAVYFLQHNNSKQAKATLEYFEKGDGLDKGATADATTLSRAYTNLCFIYFLEGNVVNDNDGKCADNYGTKAIKQDRYNAKALVNKGNCEMYKAKVAEDKNHLDQARELYNNAKELYMEGIGVEADCIEAIFNLGLCCRFLARLEYMHGHVDNYKQHIKAALQAFEKLNSILSDAPECTWNIASIYDELSEFDKKMVKKAQSAYKRLIAQVKSDAGVLARYGALLAREENDNPVYDESNAFALQHDSYRYFPCDMDVISWLGAYFVKSEMYEKAIEYFHKAAQIQPKEVKWQLMVASCHRRVGKLPEALKTYQEIERKHPDNIECLQYLKKLCKELGMQQELAEYENKLAKAEAEQQRMARPEMGNGPGAGYAQQDHYGGGGRGGGGVRDSYGGYGEFNALSSNLEGGTGGGMMGGGGGMGGGAIGGTDSEAARVVAERAAAASGKRVISKARKEDDDDWGNDELGDDLLPM